MDAAGQASPVGLASYETVDLTRSFPGVLAVDQVSISVARGEIHGIIGKNGAGKTVLMSTIAGIIPATSGRLQIGDESIDLTHHTPARARDLGIALIPQEPVFAKDLSVIDNLFMGRIPQRRGLVDFSGADRALADIAERLGIKVQPRQPMNTLALEDQQFLALGRALYVDRARILLLDEITASLSRARKVVLGQTLKRAIAERPEISVTLITHHIDEVLEFCGRVTVMRDGKAVRTISVPTTTNAILASWIVGSEDRPIAAPAVAPVIVTPVRDAADVPAATPAAPAATPAIAVHSLGIGELLKELSFELRVGEVLGIAGLDGSGKDELFAMLAGIRRPDRGTIAVGGKPQAIRSPEAARKAGIAYLPKKRDQYAILTGRPVDENALAMVYPRLTRFGLIDDGRGRRIVEDGVKALKVKTPGIHARIDDLSGGNRQKTMIIRILATEPVVYLLNEPTRGVDLATKPELLGAIRSRLATRACVIVSSEGEEELIEICDRVIALYKGSVVADLARGGPGFNAADLYRVIQGVSL
jgi:ABC-type sugar transport system ATPase subunit